MNRMTWASALAFLLLSASVGVNFYFYTGVAEVNHVLGYEEAGGFGIQTLTASVRHLVEERAQLRATVQEVENRLAELEAAHKELQAKHQELLAENTRLHNERRQIEEQLQRLYTEYEQAMQELKSYQERQAASNWLGYLIQILGLLGGG